MNDMINETNEEVVVATEVNAVEGTEATEDMTKEVVEEETTEEAGE